MADSWKSRGMLTEREEQINEQESHVIKIRFPEIRSQDLIRKK